MKISKIPSSKKSQSKSSKVKRLLHMKMSCLMRQRKLSMHRQNNLVSKMWKRRTIKKKKRKKKLTCMMKL